MATLILGAVGTLLGGPIGGAIGALAGRQVDAQIAGSGNREGPRLKELALTTSSYGSPIPRHFGKMRTAGTIIWSTDLVESKETGGGGKGKPSTTSYSYSSSFAVVLSSRPIRAVGRIWADGNLLRGAAGDLKSGGALRIYTGEGDQPVDPLLSSAEGARCPAFRGCSYAVFENLQLEDFGNRIPALTFELFADQGAIDVGELLYPVPPGAAVAAPLHGLGGFSYEGEALSGLLATIDQLYPLIADAGGDQLTINALDHISQSIIALPPAAVWDEGDFGGQEGSERERNSARKSHITGLRYYDTARDYQPGIQRAGGRAGGEPEAILQFPGALDASEASTLVTAAANRAGWAQQTLKWRLAELDTAICPGRIVTAPGNTGKWLVAGWEWREKGIELDLRRISPAPAFPASSDPGNPALPRDNLQSATWLRGIELPWDGSVTANQPAIFAAVASQSEDWSGAVIYSVGANGLEPILPSGRSQTVMGTLSSSLGGSPSLMCETDAWIDVETLAAHMQFGSVGKSGLARGENRLLIGKEIVQFGEAQQTSPKKWRLSQLLRGRGGSENIALAGHPAGSDIILLDSALIPIDATSLSFDEVGGIQIAAIGRGDEEPVLSPIVNLGIGAKPLIPVHAQIAAHPDGSVSLNWTRRARGGWNWPDHIETPLNEETELYRIGTGDPDSVPRWETRSPQITLSAFETAQHSGEAVWVRQIGRFAQSDALTLIILG